MARDGTGFMSAWCRSYQDINDPLTIEALAFRDAVLFADQNGYRSITCESDCEELVRLWQGRKAQRSVIAPILSEVEDLVPSFQFFDFVFARRTANRVAHECARYACEHATDADWFDVCPDFLSDSLQADCTTLVVI